MTAAHHTKSKSFDWSALQVGDELPALTLPPLSRHTLALYCGASGDHNPIHVDIDFAKSAGMSDVFAHGMLSVAWLGRVLTNWVPQHAIRALNVRFAAITQVGEVITCTARITSKTDAAIQLALQSANEAGVVKITGEAEVSRP